jgi:deoxyhypusine synthase
VIKELVKRKLFDVIITTGGTIDHDMARIWKDYFHGSYTVDDRELHRKEINRLGNIFIPHQSYGKILEEKVQPLLEDLYKIKNKWSTKDLVWAFGERIEKEENAENSIIYWAWKNQIPVYVPGIIDGAVGSQLWMYYQEHKDFVLDVFKDQQELSDMVFNAKKTGALIIGGGISKHHTIWWNQFIGGLELAVYITTAIEYNGSLSGASTREAISWGKIKERSNTVTIEGDATVLLPLLVSALLERLSS